MMVQCPTVNRVVQLKPLHSAASFMGRVSPLYRFSTRAGLQSRSQSTCGSRARWPRRPNIGEDESGGGAAGSQGRHPRQSLASSLQLYRYSTPSHRLAAAASHTAVHLPAVSSGLPRLCLAGHVETTPEVGTRSTDSLLLPQSCDRLLAVFPLQIYVGF
ncbi:hypothetical protein NDU88_001282 [Pleurodeles waltl]|uniref:Uncharacterized protein n=1 Tax=Pleurodeles waltl TaxID=8319 RepID=A0AAV7SB70_PLEWA|nr:hypothetical protein NDU88_001282 [Pleurodeles waltl]